MENFPEQEKPSLNKLTNFRYYAEQDEHLKCFDWNDNDLDKMSMKQFRYCKYLWTTGKYLQLKDILKNFLKIS